MIPQTPPTIAARPASHLTHILWKFPTILTLLEDIYPICTLKVDSRVIPEEKYKRMIGVKGRPYFRIDFNLLMSIDSAALVFEFEIDGTVYQDVRASYCYL